jgi:hypothetical protein
VTVGQMNCSLEVELNSRQQTDLTDTLAEERFFVSKEEKARQLPKWRQDRPGPWGMHLPKSLRIVGSDS